MAMATDQELAAMSSRYGAMAVSMTVLEPWLLSPIATLEVLCRLFQTIQFEKKKTKEKKKVRMNHEGFLCFHFLLAWERFVHDGDGRG